MSNDEKRLSEAGPNRERIRLWVEALRSGEYVQAHGALRVDGQFCCLGVACEVFRERAGMGSWLNDGFTTGGVPETSTLPVDVSDWFGFTVDSSLLRDNPEIESPTGEKWAAAEANDTHDWTFAQIADAIERTYLAEVNA